LPERVSDQLKKDKKCKGALKKTSGRSYSLEHPVARHFVCYFGSICHTNLNILKTQGPKTPAPVGIAPYDETFTCLRPFAIIMPKLLSRGILLLKSAIADIA